MATASNLRELHSLHQRAKALRDRLISGPKTIAARVANLTNRQNALEAARKALQEARVQIKKKEHTVQGINARIDDRKGRLNTVKKNEEYKAIQNEIAMEQKQIEKIEEEMLHEMELVDAQASKLAAEEIEVKALAAEVAAMKELVESQAAGHKAQLAELEAAVIAAESIIPEDLRDRYRRTVKQHGADAMAPVEYDRKVQIAACTGCFVSVTTQGLNELLNGEHLTFCKTCGRVLYMPEEEVSTTRRGA